MRAGLRCLVVVRNATRRQIVLEMLAASGVKAEAQEESNAIRCLEAAAAGSEPFAFAILDAAENTAGILREVQGNRELAGVKTVLLQSSNQLCGRDGDFQPDAYLLKPVKQSALLATLEEVLAGRTPGTPGQSMPQEDSHTGEASGLQASLRILVAEDNLVNQLVAQKMLEREGHQVTLVGTGRDAVAAVQSGAYDLVFMDVQMPEMDGFEATKAIRAVERRHTPIAAMTAHVMKGDRERCL